MRNRHYDAILLSKHRFDIDHSFLYVAVNFWSTSTNTFHLPCGPMAPTVQDICFLTGLCPHGKEVSSLMQLNYEDKFYPPTVAEVNLANDKVTVLVQSPVNPRTPRVQNKKKPLMWNMFHLRPKNESKSFPTNVRSSPVEVLLLRLATTNTSTFYLLVEQMLVL